MEGTLRFELRLFGLGNRRILRCAMRPKNGGSTRTQTEITSFEDSRPFHLDDRTVKWRASGESNPDLRVRSAPSCTLDYQPFEMVRNRGIEPLWLVCRTSA